MNRNIIILITFSLFTFVLITFFVMTNEVLIFDTVIREFIYSFQSDKLTFLLTYITYIGNWQTISILCLMFLLYKLTRISFGIPLTISAIISTILQKTLKGFFVRQRPDLYLHLIQQGGYSFPSGHALTSLVFYGMIIFLCQQNVKNKTITNTVTVLLSFLIFLIGFSRIYLGVHYPTDVLGGWTIGICLLIILAYAFLSFKLKNLDLR